MAGYKKDGIYSWKIRGNNGTFLKFDGTAEYAHKIIDEVRKNNPEEDYGLICMNCRRSNYYTEES